MAARRHKFITFNIYIYMYEIVLIIIISMIVNYKLNSSSKDELRNWCHQRLVGAGENKAQQGGFHGNPISRIQPCKWPPTSTLTLNKLEWEILT